MVRIGTVEITVEVITQNIRPFEEKEKGYINKYKEKQNK